MVDCKSVEDGTIQWAFLCLKKLCLAPTKHPYIALGGWLASSANMEGFF
jgi:hypothetical protein